MIVDDDFSFASFSKLLLESFGYETITVYDSAQAVETAKTQGPSLILTDASMPGLSGVDLIKARKADPQTSSIPILLCSITNDRTQLADAFRVGAMDFIPKPLNHDELRARINEALRLGK